MSVCLFHRKQKLFLSEIVDDIKMTGRKQNLSLMHNKMMNFVDIAEPTSFLDHVYLGCTQRECKSNEIIFKEYKEMLELRISAEAAEKYQVWKKPYAKDG